MGRAAAVFMTFCVVVSVISFTPTAAAANSDPLDDDQVFNASENVSVWERSIFPLRVQTDNAATTVQNPALRANGTGVGGASLGKTEMAVFNTSTTIELEYKDNGIEDNGNLTGTNVTTVAARVTGSGEGIPNTFSDAIDLISEENANENATYEYVGNATLSSGTDTFTYDPPQPGHYVFLTVASNQTPNKNGIEIDQNNNISVTENITLLGADAAAVERGPPNEVTRTTTNPQPGGNVTFDVDPSNQLGEDNTTQLLAVYNKDEFVNSQHTIGVDDPDELDSDFDIQNNSTFYHSIAEVDGVADVEPGAGVNGVDFSDGRVSRAVGFGAMIDFIAEDINGTAPETDRTGDTILNASMDVDVDTTADTNLTVETKSEWENGTYQYVYIGTLEDNKSAITTDAGTFEIASTQSFFEVEIDSIDDPVTTGDTIGVTLNITNTGQSGTQDVSVAVDGDVRANVSETLGADESTQTFVSLPTSAADITGTQGDVTVRADTGDQTASQTVTLQQSPQFDVNLTLNNSVVDNGDDINGTVNVTNTGGQSATQDVTVSIDGTEFFNQSDTTIAAGNSKEFTFARSTDADDAGDRTITAASDDDSDSGLVTVNEPAFFEVDIIEDESRTTVVAEQNATVVAEVQNTGDSTAGRTINIVRNDTKKTLTSVSRSLDPGEVTEVTAENATLSADAGSNFEIVATSLTGRPPVQVEDEDRTTVTVNDAPDSFFDVTIDDVDNSVDEPLPGNTTNVSVDVTIDNIGGGDGTQDIIFSIDGNQRHSSSGVSVNSGNSKELNDILVPVQNGEAPSVDLTVASDNDSETESIDVNSTAEFDVEIVEASNESQLDTLTDFAPTINVTNVGEQEGNATLTVRFNNTEEETFQVNTLAAGATNETVKPNEGFALNASSTGTKIIEAEVVNNGTDASDDTSTRRVSIGDAPNYTVESLSLSPSGTIEENNDLTIDVTINNTGDVTGDQTVVTEFGSTEVNATSLTLTNASQGNNKQTLSVTVPTGSGDVGTQTVEVSTSDDTASDTVTVEANAEFEIANVDADDTGIVGEDADVSVTVENTGGNARNTTDVRLLAGGQEVANRSLSLSNDSARIVQFDGNITPSAAGDLQVTGVTSGDTGTDTIGVGEPGDLEYELVSITDPVTTGGTLEATIRAENVGDDRAEETVSLRFNGSIVSQTTLSADAGETNRTTLTHTVGSSQGVATVDVVDPDGTDGESTTVSIVDRPSGPDFRVSNLDLPGSVLETSQTVNVTADVTNIGLENDTQNVTLSVDGTDRDFNDSVNLGSSGGSTTVDLAFNTSDVGTGSVTANISSANGSAAGTIDITQPTPGTPEIVSPELLDSEATQGELFEINATVENTGDLDLNGNVVLDYRANGTDDGSTSVNSLGPGNTTTVTVGVTPSAETRAGAFDRDFELRAENGSGTVTDTATRTAPVDFESISSGLTQASSGDTVVVASETLQERSTITIETNGITLEAANPSDRPQIQSPRTADDALVVAADDVTVANLQFTGDGNGSAVSLDGEDTTVQNVRVQNWETGISEVSGSNLVRDSRITGSESGIILDGDGGTNVEFTDVVGSDTRGILIRSDNNRLLGVRASTSTVGVDIVGDNGGRAVGNNINQSVASRNDDIGIRFRDVQGTDPTADPSGTVRNSAFDANGVDAFVDDGEVDARSNWWGTPEGARQNVDYIVRSGLDGSGPLDSRPGSQFDVSADASFGDNLTRNQQFTVTVTIDNTGSVDDLQRIELLTDGSVEDSVDVRVNDSQTKDVDLSFTPDVTDGDSVDLTVRSQDASEAETGVNVLDPAAFAVNNVNPDSTSVEEGDTLTVQPEIENTGEASAQGTVSLLVNGTQEDTATTSSISGGQTDQPSLSYTTTGSDVGNINVTVSTAGSSAETIVAVTEADDSGGPSGGGGDDDDEPTQPQPEVSGDAVASSTFDPETQTLSTQVESAAAGSSVSSSFDAGTTEQNLQETGASLNRLTTSFAQDTQDAQIDASYSQTNPSDDVPDLSEQTGTDEIAYANVDTAISEDAIDSVEFEFSVSRDRLAQNDLNPDDVALYRFNDGAYEEYDAAIDSQGDDRITYTAEVPGLSVFAIGEETEEATATATPEPDTATPEPDTATPEPDTATPEPDVDSPTEVPPEEPGGFDTIPVLVVVVVLLFGAGFLIYRQQA